MTIIPKPVDSLNSDAISLNTAKSATATIVINVVENQINYGFAGNAEEQEIMQIILKILNIFHKKV